MSNVFVLDTNKHPLDPVHPGYACLLLKSGKAAIWRRFPFTIILKCAAPRPQVEPLRIKLDPGSKMTGIAVLNDTTGEVVFAAELSHHGHQVSEALQTRRSIRRSRRARKTRYRQPRFDNRRNKKPGWLPPSLESRLTNVLTLVQRLSRLCRICAISMELVRFDMQRMENPELSGVQYQQGTLAGYEVRAYLLEKWGRQCAHCGAKDVPLEVEHITPRSKSRDDQVCNLTLACKPCNTKKGIQNIRNFLKHKPDLLQKILAQAKAPLKEAAAVNVTRWALYRWLQALGLPVECGSGGLTKYNRTTRGLPKAHWIDAACVGASTPDVISLAGVAPLLIKAMGRGSRKMCRMDKFGFPRTGSKGAKRVKGFQTGDMVKAVITAGKKSGTYVGRVAVRASGSFNITARHGTVQGISYRACTVLHRDDGYSYGYGRPPLPRPKEGTPGSSPCVEAHGEEPGGGLMKLGPTSPISDRLTSSRPVNGGGIPTDRSVGFPAALEPAIHDCIRVFVLHASTQALVSLSPRVHAGSLTPRLTIGLFHLRVRKPEIPGAPAKDQGTALSSASPKGRRVFSRRLDKRDPPLKMLIIRRTHL